MEDNSMVGCITVRWFYRRTSMCVCSRARVCVWFMVCLDDRKLFIHSPYLTRFRFLITVRSFYGVVLFSVCVKFVVCTYYGVAWKGRCMCDGVVPWCGTMYVHVMWVFRKLCPGYISATKQRLGFNISVTFTGQSSDM